MSTPPESLEVGKCYLTEKGQIRRVIAIEKGKVTYYAGRQQALGYQWPRRYVATQATFAAQAIEEMACPPSLRPEDG